MFVKSVQILSWNVDGLLSKLEDPYFMSYLNEFSFISLCETFVEYIDFAVCLPNFVRHVLPARKLSDRGRRSGVIVCLIHKDVDVFFTKLECTWDNIVVYEVCKTMLGLERDLLWFSVSIPPQGSPFYVTVDEANGVCALENCVSEMLDIYGDCAIVLCGDFNARTGNRSIDTTNDIFDMRSDVTDGKRLSSDGNGNEFGNSLVSLCLVYELTILNGCIDSYNSGKFTCLVYW